MGAGGFIFYSKKTSFPFFLALVCLHLSPTASAQCELAQLSNPSFEVGSGNDFSGWNQFNAVSETSALVTHGSRAARLAGSNSGNWDLSAVWQKQSSSPGDVWEVRAFVGHESTNPLVGANVRLLINIEWYDASGSRILNYPNAGDPGYQSFAVLTESSPYDEPQQAIVTSLPAPAGTASIHVLIGLLQSPAMEPGAAIVDNVFLRETTGVQLEDIQWNDFPGGRTLEFAGQSWRVKGPGVYGPGDNDFSDATNSVWVDAGGDLHMAIRQQGAVWYSSEIVNENVYGYGDYRFTVKGDLSDWAQNVVFGFFHWQYPLCFDGANLWNQHNEVDVELSRWNDAAEPNSQFVVQPYNAPGNIVRYETNYSNPNEITTFAYRWLANRIEFRAWKGDAQSEDFSPMIHSWVYSGPHIPREDVVRLHLNFWQFDGPPANGEDHEIVISDFVFLPAGTPEASVPMMGWFGLLILLAAQIGVSVKIKK